MGNLLADFGRASGSLQALTNQLGQRKALQVREKQFAMQRQRQNMLDDRAAAVHEQQIEKATRQNEKEKEKFDYNNEYVPITAQLENMPGGQSGPMAQMTIARLEDAGVIEKDPNRSTPELPVYKGIRHELAWEMDGITADKNFIRDSSVKSIKHLQGLINAENQEMAKKFGGVPKEKRDKNNEYIASTERIAGYDNTISALEKDLGIMNRAELTDKQKSDTIMQRQLAVDAEKRKRQAAEDKEKRKRPEKVTGKLTESTVLREFDNFALDKGQPTLKATMYKKYLTLRKEGASREDAFNQVISEFARTGGTRQEGGSFGYLWGGK